MMNLISSINTHAQLYIDHFFTENPISVLLRPFKEIKKNKKPQINLQIEYKGMEINNINFLSGGEIARLILSYTLALGEIFSCPLIMLDESTSSLDQELIITVINGIKNNLNGRLALIVMHQGVKGIFDKVINLP